MSRSNTFWSLIKFCALVLKYRYFWSLEKCSTAAALLSQLGDTHWNLIRTNVRQSLNESGTLINSVSSWVRATTELVSHLDRHTHTDRLMNKHLEKQLNLIQDLLQYINPWKPEVENFHLSNTFSCTWKKVINFFIVGLSVGAAQKILDIVFSVKKQWMFFIRLCVINQI